MTTTSLSPAEAPVGGWAPQRRLIGVGSVVTLLLVWFAVTEVFAFVTPLLLPSPVDVLAAGVRIATEPYSGTTLIGHVWASLKTVIGGWVLAMAIGVPLGLAMGWSRAVAALLEPIFNLLRPIPPIAWIPLAIVWFGIGQSARLFVVVIAATIPCVVNSREGAKQVDPILLRAARTLGADRSTTLRGVVLPSAAPLVFTGIRLSLGNAWMTLVGAELVAASAGLGFLLLDARRSLQSDVLFLSMVSIGLLGALFSAALRWIEPRVLPWAVEHRDR